MNKFEKVAEFIESQIKEKGLDAVSMEIEKLMLDEGLNDGPTLASLFDTSEYTEQYYFDEELSSMELAGSLAPMETNTLFSAESFKKFGAELHIEEKLSNELINRFSEAA